MFCVNTRTVGEVVGVSFLGFVVNSQYLQVLIKSHNMIFVITVENYGMVAIHKASEAHWASHL
jgi:hypothetical protein